MRDDPYRLLILTVGIPLTVWFLTDPSWVTSRMKFGIALLWFGTGGTLLLLSRRER